ncbi:hypothetical protein MTO96_011503 [Rhipicephalus appendiculatus]
MSTGPAKAAAACATTSDSLFSPSSYELATACRTPEVSRQHHQQLEQQVVTTIGDWLLQKAKKASPTAPRIASACRVICGRHRRPQHRRPVSTTTDGEDMDVTAASRQRGRDHASSDGPRKQAPTDLAVIDRNILLCAGRRGDFCCAGCTSSDRSELR